MARDPFAGISWRGVYGRRWRDFWRDVWRGLNNDNVFNGAAALGYYFTLALFPAMIFLLSLIPYLPIPNLQEQVLNSLYQALPGETAGMVSDTVLGVVAQKRGGLLSVGALLTIWAASNGIYALMQQLNITYHVVEARPFWKTRVTAFLLVVGFGVLTLSSVFLVIVGGNLENWLANHIYWNNAFSAIYEFGRWVFVAFALCLAFSLVFYFGPDVDQKFRFVTPGSVLGVLFLLGASLLFKLYVQNFSDYNATYGSIGTVIVLMLWLNILGLVVLLGSEVNALLEHYSPKGKVLGEKEPEAKAS